LARIEAELSEWKGRLTATPYYSAEELMERLDLTEAELLRVLNYRELAALRDYVRKSFQDARIAIERARWTERTARIHLARFPQVMLASWVRLAVSSPGKSVPKPAADSVVDEIIRKIHRLYLMAYDDDMTTTLCVTSDPDSGARFLMRPQSYNRNRETSTNNEITGLYRGLYVYSMSSGSKRKECLNPDRDSCGPIDLVDDIRPIFHCDLDKKTCARQPGACHGSGS
jgi:hypothetical protein